MKRILISSLVVLSVACTLLVYPDLVPVTQHSNSDKNSSITFGNEEKPEEVISPGEQAVNKRHLERLLKYTSNLRNEHSSSYANGQLTGTWEQFQFLTSDNQHYGYRVDGSVYDQFNDVLYAISYAGHLWKINRKGSHFSQTEWELINHKANFKTSYIEGINLENDAFRMLRSSKSGMQYSNDEGRSWVNAGGIQLVEQSYEGAVSKNENGNRVIVAGKSNPSTIKVYVSLNDGISYSAMSPSFNANNYTVKIFKPCFSESVFLAAFNKSTSKIDIYECSAEDADFNLIYSPANTFTGLTRIFGTFTNGNYHLYIAGAATHIYYSKDKGASWQVKSITNSGDGDIYPRTVHPTKPNIIFKGYLDVYKSNDYGTTFSNFSHYLGWDVHHMKMYQKLDGSYFHFVGKDFGCYVSKTPEIASSYVQLNHTSPVQMVYDADHSQNYESSFTGTQDRGTMGYINSTNASQTVDVKTTDGLRVTLANNDLSVWTWMYYGSIFRKTNFVTTNSGVTGIHGKGNWWAAPMIASPNSKEDAVYLAYGNNLTKLTFNPVQQSIIETKHYFDFNEETGSKISGFGYSPLNLNRWYVSVKNGTFLFSEDGGQTFTKTTYSGTKPLSEGNWHKNQHVIRASRIDEQTVYYAGVGNVFLISKDGGRTFSNHNNGLDIYRIRDFDISADEKFVFAACGAGGIWVYDVDADFWYPMIDASVPYVQFTDVEFIEKENAVKFGTYGSGVLSYTIDGDHQIIKHPEKLTAEITAEGFVRLQWEDKSNNEDGFIIERARNNSFTQLAIASANQVNYIDSEMLEPGNYQYRVKAFSANDESHYANYAFIEIKGEGEVSKKKWTLVSVDSEETSGYPAEFAFDEDESTMWHTQWTINPIPAYPHTLVIDMNETLMLQGFGYLPRQDYHWNGTFKDYEFYVSVDNMNWNRVAFGSFDKTIDNKVVNFDSPQQARYIKIIGLSEVNDKVFGSCAELSVYTETQSTKKLGTPQFVQGGRLSDTEIELIWLDMSNEEDGFILEQLIDGSFSPVFTSEKDVTNYTLYNTNINTTYSFRVQAFNEGANSEYSDPISILAHGSTSVSDNFIINAEVTIYPNPFESEFNIDFGGIGKDTTWDLYNLSGRIIKTGNISTNKNIERIDAESLSPGIYILRIGKGKNGISKKIVKQ